MRHCYKLMKICNIIISTNFAWICQKIALNINFNKCSMKNYFHRHHRHPPLNSDAGAAPAQIQKHCNTPPPTPPAKVVAFTSHSTINGAHVYFLYLNIGWGYGGVWGVWVCVCAPVSLNFVQDCLWNLKNK